VYFIDLDGTNDATRRRRETSILAYEEERIVTRESAAIPVSNDAFDAVNLADPSFGLLARVNALLNCNGIQHGRLDLVLGPRERGAALTVNEYETLLMRHDLVEALRNPARFAWMARRLVRSRAVSLPAVADGGGAARLGRGTYQSPILFQWRAAQRRQRRVDITVVELSCQPVSSLVAVPCPMQMCR
jgi:hypothetical protein